MRFKGIILAICLLMFTVSVLGCAGEEEVDAEKVFRLKLGHVGPADANHPWEKHAQEFAKQVEDRTNGRVVVDTFPASQLGADREMTEALYEGTMDIGLISTIAMGNFVKELQVWDLPYIFPDDNKIVDEILEGPIGDKLIEMTEQSGLYIMAYWENDWRNMSNSKRPIESVADLKDLKMRVVENQPSLDWFERIGTIPTPMAFSELYTALQQKTVDGQDNGPVLTFGSRLFEVQKYYTVTNHIYCPLAFIISGKTWSKLPDDVKETIQELAVTIGREQRADNRIMAQGFIDDMEAAGVEIVRELKADDLRGFQESALDTYDALESTVGAELINMMLEYRK